MFRIDSAKYVCAITFVAGALFAGGAAAAEEPLPVTSQGLAGGELGEMVLGAAPSEATTGAATKATVALNGVKWSAPSGAESWQFPDEPGFTLDGIQGERAWLVTEGEKVTAFVVTASSFEEAGAKKIRAAAEALCKDVGGLTTLAIPGLPGKGGSGPGGDTTSQCSGEANEREYHVFFSTADDGGTTMARMEAVVVHDPALSGPAVLKGGK